jgi:DNA replication and repair protein RecF
MFIRELSVSNLRNLLDLSLVFDEKINAFWGDNGAGKTSLLEALFFLVAGRSFRVTRLRNLLTHHQQTLMLFACVQMPQQRDIKIGLRKNLQQAFEIKINGEMQSSLLPVAQVIPMQVIAPDRASLVDDDAETRRRYIDWGVFHVEPHFPLLWKQLRYVVKQRNSLLKQQVDSTQFLPWNQLLLSLSLQIQQMRFDYVKGLVEIFQTFLEVDNDAFQLVLDPGWPQERSLEECLQSSLLQDKRLGYSQYGAHRADLKLLYNGQLAKTQLSRGQRKLLNVRLLMAQIQYLFKVHGKNSVCLIDDLASELDAASREKIYQALQGMQSQVFITGVNLDPVLLKQKRAMKVFHVEQGGFVHQTAAIEV